MYILCDTHVIFTPITEKRFKVVVFLRIDIIRSAISHCEENDGIVDFLAAVLGWLEHISIEVVDGQILGLWVDLRGTDGGG